MPERSTISQGVQIGKETVIGSVVTANKQLQAMGVELTPNLTFSQFKPFGYKTNTISALDTEMSDANITGYPTYTELVYPLSSVLGAATIATPGGATLARTWTWAPSAVAAVPPVSFSVQTGDGNFNEKAAGLVVSDMNIDVARDGIGMGGKGFAGNVTFTAGAMDSLSGSAIPLIPILPKECSVYMDDLPGTLTSNNIDSAFGTTKLTRVQHGNFSVASRYGQEWVVDAAQSSYVAVIEVDPTWQFELALQADSNGMGLLAAARAGTPKLIRLEGVSSTMIESTTPYKMTLDMYCQITAGGAKSDSNGVQVVTWTFDLMYSSVWTKHMRLVLQNGLTAL